MSKIFNVGEKATQEFHITDEMIIQFAKLSNDLNPIHLDEQYASESRFKARIAHGILIASFISAVLGTQLPGPGAIYINQDLKFTAPVYIGDTITVIVAVLDWDKQSKKLKLSTICKNQNKKIVLQGEAKLLVEE